MKLKISAFFTFLFFSILIHAQDMRTVFTNIPDSLSPLFTKVNREDFADFLESNMKAEVKNKFEGTSEMKKLTDNYLLLETTPSSYQQMKLLPVNDTTKVVCMINTVMGPVADSSIRFFSTSWTEQSMANYLEWPSVKSFFMTPDSINTEEWQQVISNLDLYLIKADLSENDNTLTFTLTTPEYLDDETLEKVKPFLKASPIVYIWRDGRFVLRNE